MFISAESDRFLACNRIMPFIIFIFLFFPALSMATTVRVETSLGSFDIELFDDEAPITVANFLNYVNSGAYVNSLWHRSMPGFIIQSGGYTYDSSGGIVDILPNDPIVNEFSPSRSNLRGTVALAKIPDDPDSATSGWFVNLVDNSANLDSQNEGFTVFGEVSETGMNIVDALAASSVVDLSGVMGSAFSDLPVQTIHDSGEVYGADLLMVSSILVLQTSDADRVFDYLQAQYPTYISPPTAKFGNASGYYYRYYPDTNSYIGIANETLYYFGPNSGNQLQMLGSLAEWLVTASAAGY